MNGSDPEGWNTEMKSPQLLNKTFIKSFLMIKETHQGSILHERHGAFCFAQAYERKLMNVPCASNVRSWLT